jgi:hypothetical protein
MDRFIPLRRNCPIELGKFEITEEDDENNLRGK